MKKLLIALMGIVGLLTPMSVLAGTSGSVVNSLKKLPHYGVFGDLLTGSGFPAVGTKFMNPLSPASLTYDKLNGHYHVVVLNPHDQYINLKKDKNGQSYFTISKQEAEKVVAIMKNTVSCKAYLTNWHARPCSVQKIVTKNSVTWIPHTTADVYAEMEKLAIIPRPKSTKYYTNGSRVYMNVLGVRFVVNGKSVIVPNMSAITH